jgi:PhnB protein
VALYERVLGAKVEDLKRFSDMPGMPPEEGKKILHAQLRIGESLLMLSDAMQGEPPAPTGFVSIVLHFDDMQEFTRVFEELAQGGEVTMGLHTMPWGNRLGAVTDRFGVQWMVHCKI